MPNNPDFQRFAVLDYEGVLQMASTIFAYVENTYVRRSVYESDIATLTSRVDAVDAVNRYEFDLDPQTGQLTFTLPDDETCDLSVDENGYLVLTECKKKSKRDFIVILVLSHYTFTQDNDGILYLTVN